MDDFTIKDRIYAEAKKQKISIPDLEHKCGFGNGTIGKWNKSKPSHEKLALVANVLNVPVFVLSGEIRATEIESNFRTHLQQLSADLWVKQQVAITDEFMQADTSGMTKEEQSVFLQQLIDKYAPYRIAPTDSSSESIASSLDQLSDNQLDDLFMKLISGKDKDYLLRLASKILEMASQK